MGRGRRGIGLVALAVAFVAVHAWLAFANTDTVHNPQGDVIGAYRFWVQQWHTTGLLVGIDLDWVYPVAALPWLLAADLFGDQHYLTTWLWIVTLLDAGATALLAVRRPAIAWWWLAFTFLLGPVALSRLDGVALPIAVAGVLAVHRRPWLASAVLTLAAWIKVWPAALVAALLVATRRIASVVTAAALTTAAVLGLALLAGARGHLFGFVAAQTSRGLQVEAPIALVWLWSAAVGDPTVQLYYDTDVLTWQVRGPGVLAAAEWMTPVLLAGVLAVLGLAIAARVRGVEPGVLLAVTGLGFVAAVIALNKVGSPQYLTWYVAPIVLGLLVDPRRFWPVAAVALVAAGLTQVIYPYQYTRLLRLEPAMIAVLTVRNLLQVGLLGWCLVELAALRPPIRMRTGVVPLPSGGARAPR